MTRSKKGKRIGILTAGGDCPGLNAAIRGVGKTAIVEYGMKVYGISDGFLGLINQDYVELTESHLSGILTLGGTILGTSREKPFKKEDHFNAVDKPKLIKEHYNDLKLDALVCIGGNGTQKTAYKLSKAGLNIIGIPKTIDNDVWGTDISFGFDSAVSIATEAIDRLHTTANSHKRIMVIEIMGHHTGWLTLYSGLAGGGDIILLPELGYDEDVVAHNLIKRIEREKPYSIVVVAEGIKKPKELSAAHHISERINQLTGLESRETILGYTQRGGSPTPYDRILATYYGAYAIELITKKKFGNMVAIQNDKITSISLKEVAGKLREVPKNYPLVKMGNNMGVCFGN